MTATMMRDLLEGPYAFRRSLACCLRTAVDTEARWAAGAVRCAAVFARALPVRGAAGRCCRTWPPRACRRACWCARLICPLGLELRLRCWACLWAWALRELVRLLVWCAGLLCCAFLFVFTEFGIAQ